MFVENNVGAGFDLPLHLYTRNHHQYLSFCLKNECPEFHSPFFMITFATNNIHLCHSTQIYITAEQSA